jgi:hypothetical protein
MIRTFVAAGLAVGLSVLPGPAGAQEKLFDNFNPAACAFTERAGFDLAQPTRLAGVELWYSWQQGESAVDFTLSIDGNQLTQGQLMRDSCDPYQGNWCVARANLELDAPAGYVEITAAQPRLCQNAGSGGFGFIRAYGTPQ